jgi:methylated-DNA-[protein]-cysteine S-methyltransferase
MTTPIITTTVDSPIGPLTLTADDGRLTGLHMHEQRHTPSVMAGVRRDDAWFADITDQLEAYFDGSLTRFEIPMELDGTDFQQRVWSQLCAIPYGETISYAELARRVGNPRASRAVGLANGRNPIAVIVPCHRVIASGGGLGGYGGGLDRKTWLLDLEAGRRSGAGGRTGCEAAVQ